MRKLLSGLASVGITISSLTLIGTAAVAAPGDYNCDLDGAGSVASPYLIASRADLEEMNDCDDQSNKKFFRQTMSIDLSGSNWTPIQGLYGEYDGNNNAIYNLEIDLPLDTQPVGLFRNSGRSAVVKDLILRVKSVVGKENVGSLFGMFQGDQLSNITVSSLVDDDSHVQAVSAVSYSISSNEVTINIGAGHTVKVGAQFVLGETGIGPLPLKTVHAVSTVNSGAGTITVPFEAADLTSTPVTPAVALTVVNPIVKGTLGVGGVIGRLYGYYASAINSQVHLNQTVKFDSGSVSLSVAGEDAVGGVVGSVERTAFSDISFTGQVSGLPASNNDAIGGLAGRSYDARWSESWAQASVVGAGVAVGGLIGQVDDSSHKLYCAENSPVKFTSVSGSSGAVHFVYPLGTDHGFAVNDQVALRVFAMFNAPSQIEDGAIGTVSSITTGSEIEVTVLVTGTTAFTSENYYPTEFLVPIRAESEDCLSGVHTSAFYGTVSAGVNGMGYSQAGGIAGVFSRSFARDLEVDGNVSGQGSWVGGLFGDSQGSDLDNLEFSGEGSSVDGTYRVGGIAGYSTGFSRSAYPTPLKQISAKNLTVGSVPVTGVDYVGGLFGSSSALSVFSSTSAASVSGTARVGGLFGASGYSSSIIDSSYAGSWVFGPGGYVGGIVGDMQGTESAVAIATATRLSATSTRFTTSDNHMLFAGEYVWMQFDSEGISQVSKVTNIVDGNTFDLEIETDGTFSVASGDEFVDFNAIENTHVTQSVPMYNAGSIRADGSNVGGIAGTMTSTVMKSSSNKLQLRIGLGAGNDGSNIGGLVGSAYHGTPLKAFVTDSFSTANIYADSNFDELRNVGGLFGEIGGYEVSGTYFKGNIEIPDSVTGTSVTNLGGIAGSSTNSQILSSYAKADISSAVGSNVGGVVGEQYTTSNPPVSVGVSTSFFDGSIAIPAGTKIGGVVGRTNQSVSYSHATASLVGDTVVGGIIGEPVASPDIAASYFDGVLTRTDSVTTTEVLGDTANTGYSGDITSAFWNSTSQTSTLTSGAKTEEELSNPATFASWTEFANYYFMPSATLTTKPFPTLSALVQAPAALEIQNPATDLDGILEGTQIVPIQVTAWGYPRPVLEVMGTLPVGLSASAFTVSGTPSASGAYSFSLAAKNTVGSGAATAFTGTVASLTPAATPAYEGPVISSLAPNPAVVGKVVTLTGAKLESVTQVRVGGLSIEPTAVATGSISFVVPALQVGTYDLILVSSFGLVTIQQGISIVKNPANGASVRKQSNGTVKIYHFYPEGAGKIQFFFNGKEVAWFNSENPRASQLRSGYLVRTRALAPGKNVIEIVVDGVRVKRVAYTR